MKLKELIDVLTPSETICVTDQDQPTLLLYKQKNDPDIDWKAQKQFIAEYGDYTVLMATIATIHEHIINPDSIVDSYPCLDIRIQKAEKN